MKQVKQFFLEAESPILKATYSKNPKCWYNHYGYKIILANPEVILKRISATWLQ